MIETDRPRFAVVVNALAATFRVEPSKAMLTGYWSALADLPIEAVEAAGQRALRGCKFMPVPAELRELAGVMTPADRAIKAWEAFTRAVSAVGYYQSPDFDDVLINATVRNLGGWMETIVRMEDEDKTDKWVRKDFERIYVSLVNSGIGEAAGGHLLGYHEQNNCLNGYGDQIAPPVKVRTGLPPLRQLPNDPADRAKLLIGGVE